MNLKDIGWKVEDSIDLVQGEETWNALVNTLMKFRVP